MPPWTGRSPKQDQNEEKTQPPQLPEQTSEEEEEEPARDKSKRKERKQFQRKQRRERALPVSVVSSAGLRPSQRGAPPIAPPHSRLRLPSRRFEKPLEGGRALTPTASRRASTNRERAAPPLPFTPSAGEIGGRIRRENSGGRIRAGEFGWEKPRTIAILLASLLAFSDGFQCGNRRSVVRGGWRSQASVVAKMAVVVVRVIVAWLALWCTWWQLLSWRFVAMVVQNNNR